MDEKDYRALAMLNLIDNTQLVIILGYLASVSNSVRFVQKAVGGRSPPLPSFFQPNVFWCILGIILHLFECLHDEEFPVICAPFCMSLELMYVLISGHLLHVTVFA